MEPFVPLTWEAPEYHHQPKTTDWYWAVGLVAVSIAATAVIFNNIILAILVAVGAFSLMLVASRPPRMINILIDRSGVVVGKFRYPYDTLDSFWIHEYGHTAKLLISSKKTLASHIVVLVQDISPEEIREALGSYLREKEQHEPLMQLLMEYLGF